MPGLSQLKKFNSDILALGDETRLRALRGERPVAVPIPKDVQDINDAEDFVLGIPEEDSVGTGESSANTENADISLSTGASSDTPDLSDILNPMADASDSTSDFPDLSEFGESGDVSADKKEDSIADMGLNDLLAGAGFDVAENIKQDDDLSDNSGDSVVDLGLGGAGAPNLDFLNDDIAGAPNLDFLNDDFDLGQADNDLGIEPAESESKKEEPKAEKKEETVEATSSADDLHSFEDDFHYSGSAIDLTDGLPDEVTERNEVKVAEKEPENLDAENLGFDVSDSGLDVSDLDFNIGEQSADTPAESMPSDSAPSENVEDSIGDLDEATDDDLGDFDLDTGDILAEQDSDTASLAEYDKLSASGDSDSGFGDMDFNMDSPATDSLDISDIDSGLPSDDIDVDSLLNDMGAGTSTESPDNSFADIDMPSLDDNASDVVAPTDEAASIDSSFDVGDLNFDMESDSSAENEPVESFDTSDMEGLDFSIPSTDAQISGDVPSSDGDFDEFSIPGFSDTDTAETKGGRIVAPQPAAAAAQEDTAETPNTLTDDEYKKFLINLSGYPLNVRIAIENMLVKNEFTDDAEIEVIKKVIKKVPARQLAGHLEKMLDISLPVPRDFERRTVAEYEAIKSSFKYQLKNRIIPLAIVSILVAGLLYGITLASLRFIVKPLRANNYYKQGYALIESNDYPQSEILFEKATEIDLQKQWFFKYAQAYRANKQYDRAEKMYRNILNYFSHDKQAGLEYAEMEFMDLANYEKAENILRRDVLDYHVNDPDALLMLGDVFLEWATERDPSKFEDARIQYASLIEQSKQNKDTSKMNLYLSRMMRYFIRVDNLKEVLALKETFMSQIERNPKKDPLSGEDWTEMSGYLFDKLFGPLTPAEEYLRRNIEDVLEMLQRAVLTNRENPVSSYNLARYYVQMNNSVYARAALRQTIDIFSDTATLKPRDVYKYIDTYRLLGEEYIESGETLLARETYTNGLALYQDAHESSGLEGTPQIGLLFADMGDMDYFVEGDHDSAYRNYLESVNLGNDTSEIRYKLGYIQYYRKNYDEALNSFLYSADKNPGDDNLLLALANTLALRGNSHAAEGYYSRLMGQLEEERSQRDVLLPQVKEDDADFVELMMRASNNYGVTLYNMAARTGSSAQNAQAMVQLSLSMRAWDALTRNQMSLERIGGSNLAEQNIAYMSRPISNFEPAIYTDIWNTLSSDEGLGE